MNVMPPHISMNAQHPATESTYVAGNSKNSTPDSVDSAQALTSTSVKVSLSPQGLKKAADASANADIEQSGLPDKTQKLLKMIREIQKQIDEKNEELRSVMENNSLSDEEKRTKAGALRTTLATLTASLMTASTTLDNMTKNGTLTAAQGLQAAQLAMKKIS